MNPSRTTHNQAKIKSAVQAVYPAASQIVWKRDGSVWGTLDGHRLTLGVVQAVNEYGAVDFFTNTN